MAAIGSAGAAGDGGLASFSSASAQSTSYVQDSQSESQSAAAWINAPIVGNAAVDTGFDEGVGTYDINKISMGAPERQLQVQQPADTASSVEPTFNSAQVAASYAQWSGLC